MANRERLQAAVDHIEADPETWDQGSWHCGTAHCLFGHGQIMSGKLARGDAWSAGKKWFETTVRESNWLSASHRTIADFKAFIVANGIPEGNYILDSRNGIG